MSVQQYNNITIKMIKSNINYRITREHRITFSFKY